MQQEGRSDASEREATMNSLDLGRAFKAPFDDPEWVNRSLMGTLWLLLGVTSPVVYGAHLDYIRRVSRGDERLPDFEDFGGKWVQGLLVAVAGFLYFLPVLVLGGIFVLPAAFAAMAEGEAEAVGALFTGGICVFSVLSIAYAVAVSVLFSAAMTHYAMNPQFGSFFQFGVIMQKVRGRTGYFTAWMYVLIISFALSTLTSLLSSITFGFGALLALPASYLATMMTAHVLGQWARAAYGPSPIGAGQAPPVYGAPGGYASPPAPPASGQTGVYAPPQAPSPPAPAPMEPANQDFPPPPPPPAL